MAVPVGPVASAVPAVVETPVVVPVTAPQSRRSRRTPVVEPAIVELEIEPDAAASESVIDEPIVTSADEPPVSAGSADDDAFEAAARLFSFTGETPVQAPAAPVEDEAQAETSHVASRRVRGNRGASFKRVAASSFSIGVIGIVGLLTVGMTTPADAVALASGSTPTTSLVAAPAGDVAIDKDQIQAYVTPSTLQNTSLDRPETYSTLTMADLASESGISNFSDFYVNNPNSPIQWPFAVGVPISYGFGMRDGTMHEGADFIPGEGSPIQAIADGVVRESTDSGGAYGVSIIIDHIIDGELVSSHYAHMQYGSRQVEVGDKVTVGTVIGHTGNTGRSYGAHTHFEILANGTTPIDPIPWLRQHAGG